MKLGKGWRKGRTGGPKKHGLSKSITYQAWDNMIGRCSRPETNGYEKYGGAGIVVCDRWHNFENFLADVGKRPGREYTLERDNRARGYEPGNCRWATKKEQQRNRSSNVNVTHDGRTQCIAAWAEETRLPYQTIRMRLKYGWPAAKALTTPVTPPNRRRAMTRGG